jgi:thioredoxin-dependent peroxiredoxin
MALEYSTVRVGDIAPDFTLLTDAGEPLTLSSLRGKRVVLFFYPKDSSPGCTVEACEFSDLVPRFKRRKVVVLGIAPGTVRSKARFKSRHGLAFGLLNDADAVAAQAYGVWREKVLFGHRYLGVMRTTFVVGADGRVERIWEHVEHAGHAAEVDAFLRGADVPGRPAQGRRAAKKK